VESQCLRLFEAIRTQVAKALFRNTMVDLFGRLQSPRKRVVSGRKVMLLNLLLDEETILFSELRRRLLPAYSKVKNPHKALVRDLGELLALEAIGYTPADLDTDVGLHINIDWPMQITETEFFSRTKAMPKGKVHGFLSR